MSTFGVIGNPISHSFSPAYFAEKFKKLRLPFSYAAIEILDDSQLAPFLVQTHLDGFNVTIPFKQSIIPFLDRVDPSAEAIGAVNCVKRTDKGWIGYNTDHIGFSKTLREMNISGKKAMLLGGSGGAAAAVKYALNEMGFEVILVSRERGDDRISYDDISAHLVKDQSVVINATPLGMYPKIGEKPALPYSAFHPKIALYDLIYNPRVTAFLAEGLKRGCAVRNGLQMLRIQADESWKIWRS